MVRLAILNCNQQTSAIPEIVFAKLHKIYTRSVLSGMTGKLSCACKRLHRTGG